MIVDEGVERCAQFGVVGGLKNESDGFHPFIEVGVGVKRAFARCVFAAGEAAEVVDDPVHFEQIEHGGNAALYVDLPARLPETVAELDRANRDRMHYGIGRMIEIDDSLIPPVVGGG